jgi:hypothetical protein
VLLEPFGCKTKAKLLWRLAFFSNSLGERFTTVAERREWDISSSSSYHRQYYCSGTTEKGDGATILHVITHGNIRHIPWSFDCNPSQEENRGVLNCTPQVPREVPLVSRIGQFQHTLLCASFSAVTMDGGTGGGDDTKHRA